MKEVQELFNLCIENNLFFNFDPNAKVINVYNKDMTFSYYTYYEGNLSALPSDGKRKNISDLIKIITNTK